MIKVLFELKQLYYWAMMKPIYDELAQDKNYLLKIRVGENHTRVAGLFLKADKPRIEKELMKEGYEITNKVTGFDFVFCGDTLKNPEEFGNALLCHVDHSISIKTQRYRSLAKQTDVRYLRFVEGQYRIDKFKEFGIDKNIDIYNIGTPKLDGYFKSSYSSKPVYDKLNLDVNKKTILYAPSYKPTSIFELGEVITSTKMSDKYNVLIKLHPYSWAGKYASHKQNRFIQKLVKNNSHVILIPKEDHNVVPYLFAADTLISDASGVINEFLVLGKCGVIFDLNYSELTHSDGEAVLAENLDNWLGDAFVHIHQPQDIFKAIETAINPTSDQIKEIERIKDYICHLTDGNATKRIKKVLEERFSKK